MRYIWQHIKTIIENYKGEIPLAHFLKSYFKQFPILGSRDRKQLSSMAYCWYRCSKGVSAEAEMGMEQRIQTCLKLCNIESPLVALNPDHINFDLDAIFPFITALSDGIAREDWLRSMLVQPALFIRIRKDKGKIVSLLNAKQIPSNFISDNCLSLPNGAKIDEVLAPDSYVVQDASSQRTGTFFTPKKNELWYDCCSGAGGKALLLKDMEPGVRLTVTDKRESIIHNLQQRFRQYRHILPTAHITDVADKEQLEKTLGTKLFDNIICDAPCSGSGTWARTPEHLYFFDPGTIERFSTLQKQIVINVSRFLKPGGRLIYITCSAFKDENEMVVAELIEQTGLQLIQSELINGISIHADSMFIAVLTKN
jgi:16S rRNA (cytosine967-C5)-methyltransferase